MSRPVQIVHTDERTITIRPEGYKLKPEQGRIARLLWWGLEKLKALEPFGYRTRVYTYAESQKAELSKKLFEFCEHAVYRPDDYIFLVGEAEWRELLHYDQRDILDGPILAHAGPFTRGDGTVANVRHTVYDVPVMIVPRMKGYCAVKRSDLRSELARKGEGETFERSWDPMLDRMDWLFNKPRFETRGPAPTTALNPARLPG